MSQVFESQGVEINYFDNGLPGTEAIVFIHGNSHGLRSFRYQMQDNQLQKYRLVAIDLPGHGNSGRAQYYGMQLFIDVMNDLVRELGLTKFVLVGHSLGGHIAIESIPTLNPAGVFIFGAPPLKKPLDVSGFKSHLSMSLLQKKLLSDEEIILMLSSFYRAYTPGQEDIGEIKKTDPMVRPMLAESFGKGNYSDEVLILEEYVGLKAFIHGSQDQLIDYNYLANELGDKNIWRNAILNLMGPHNLQVENFKEVNSLILDFVEEAFASGPVLISRAPTEIGMVSL